MAMFGDDQGRTEKPTPERLGEARNRGDTSLSRELLLAGPLLVAALLLRWVGGWLLADFGTALRHGLHVDLRHHPIASADVPGACHQILASLALVAAPALLLLAVFLVAAALTGYAQIGLKISKQVFALKFERLDPAANWKRLVNVQAIVRTAFAAVKIGILVLVLWLVLGSRWHEVFLLHELPFATACAVLADLALSILLWVAAVVSALAVADVFWQRFDFEKRNMMSRQEVEDERRRNEGDPLVRGRLRQARIELLKHRMMQAVPKADVVVTNPTHYSVALRYDRKQNRAPEVVAKGADELALRIRELAKANGVPLLEDPPLARALYRAVKVGQEIPEKFYQAVATVLSHVYRLRGRVA
jgi:flagellar biosynthetic protein FlhB